MDLITKYCTQDLTINHNPYSYGHAQSCMYYNDKTRTIVRVLVDW
ncbi:hypothetical protein DSUL_90069 [Desulfovibrionales bacterium]